MDKANNLIRYTKIATVIFTGLVVAADVFGIIISRFITLVWAGRSDNFAFVLLTAVLYVGTAGAYLVLIPLYKLLGNMQKDIVFDTRNTKLMKIISYGCIFMGIDCFAGMLAWTGTMYLGVICLFMMLIILCVRAVFEKAIAMKDELDLTI